MKLVKILVLTLVVMSLMSGSMVFAATKSTVRRYSITCSVVAIGP